MIIKKIGNLLKDKDVAEEFICTSSHSSEIAEDLTSSLLAYIKSTNEGEGGGELSTKYRTMMADTILEHGLIKKATSALNTPDSLENGHEKITTEVLMVENGTGEDKHIDPMHGVAAPNVLSSALRCVLTNFCPLTKLLTPKNWKIWGNFIQQYILIDF